MIAFKDKEAQVTKQTRKELLASWQSIIQDKNKPTHNKPQTDTHKN
jgi:hypothetical protein